MQVTICVNGEQTSVGGTVHGQSFTYLESTGKGWPWQCEYDRTKQSSAEDAVIEMYLAEISLCCVEDITEVRWGTKGSSSTVRELIRFPSREIV